MGPLMSGPLNLVSKEFNKKTALFFALLSKAAYYSPKAFIHFLRQQQISENIQYTFIEKDSSQAYVLWDDENFIVTFRGMDQDEKLDSKFWKKTAWEGGRVHRGFEKYVNKIWDDIKVLFFEHGVNPNRQTKKVWFCGHSLGGAAATIGAARLGTFSTGCFTYGSPRVGTKAFVKSIYCPVWRFRNHIDVITRGPTPLLFFKHAGRLCYIDSNHKLHIGVFKFFKLFKDRVKSIFNSGLDAHEIGEYCKHINTSIGK